MVRFFALALASTALVGATQAPPAAAVGTPEASAPRPQYGTFGFDTAGMDNSVVPGNDFFDYANGTWLKNTPIPADKARYGMFNTLDDLSKTRTRGIIEEQTKNPNSKIGNAYLSFMDEAGVDAKGLKPFEPWLSRVRAVKTKAELTKLYADADRLSIPIPFRMFVGQDRKASDRYALNVIQGGIGMPDRDYYLSTDPKQVDTKAKYLQHMTNMLTLAGEPNAAARAQAILDFETKVAQVQWTRAESRDANKTYNKMTIAQVRKFAPGFDFPLLLKDAGTNVGYVVVAQPSAFKGISSLIASTPLPVLRDQMLVRSLDSYASYLP
ncbi:MAG TPA: M13 family metallopeptidase N-terminal domain-containing protein, partial [Sphingomicrobium sp.]